MDECRIYLYLYMKIKILVNLWTDNFKDTVNEFVLGNIGFINYGVVHWILIIRVLFCEFNTG